jgi:hypothetical protein
MWVVRLFSFPPCKGGVRGGFSRGSKAGVNRLDLPRMGAALELEAEGIQQLEDRPAERPQ